jgi:hypothetical protein
MAKGRKKTRKAHLPTPAPSDIFPSDLLEPIGDTLEVENKPIQKSKNVSHVRINNTSSHLFSTLFWEGKVLKGGPG